MDSKILIETLIALADKNEDVVTISIIQLRMKTGFRESMAILSDLIRTGAISEIEGKCYLNPVFIS